MAAPLHGRKSSISTSAVQLSASTAPLEYGIEVKAAAGNSGTVYVGSSNAVTADAADATDGFPLAAGDQVFIPRAFADGKPLSLSSVWLIGSAASQKVFFLAV